MGPQPRIQLNRLSSEIDFESLLRDICAEEWDNPNVEKFGRRGQKQYGVDVYGQPSGLAGTYWAVQCKHRATQTKLTKKEILAEVNSAKTFPHKLARLIIATDLPIDKDTQVIIDKINDELNLDFKVSIWFWDRIERQISAHPKILAEYYSDLSVRLTNNTSFSQLVNVPLQVYAPSIGNHLESAELHSLIKIYGIRLTSSEANSNELDGILLDYRFSFDANYLVTIGLQHKNSLMPIWVVANDQIIDELKGDLREFDINPARFSFIYDTNNLNIVSSIFPEVLQFGYTQRGKLPTVNILARSLAGNASALLDMEWLTLGGENGYPDSQIWEDYYYSAIKNIASQIAAWGNQTIVQIDCRLPIPAAVALGFAFNTRLVSLSVWSRIAGKNDFRQQYWSADSDPECQLEIKSIQRQKMVSGTSAILEISSGPSIYKSVSDFASATNLKVAQWFSLELQQNSGNSVNIDAGCAIFLAETASRFVRQLNEQGITDVHLFMRVPAALAVLIGNRLQGCGRLHLHWYLNPGYQYAFELS